MKPNAAVMAWDSLAGRTWNLCGGWESRFAALSEAHGDDGSRVRIPQSGAGLHIARRTRGGRHR